MKPDLGFIKHMIFHECEDLNMNAIRGATRKGGFTCARADEIEHNSDQKNSALKCFEKRCNV